MGIETRFCEGAVSTVVHLRECPSRELPLYILFQKSRVRVISWRLTVFTRIDAAPE